MPELPNASIPATSPAPQDGVWRAAGINRAASLLQVSAATAMLIGVPTVTHAAAYRLAFLTQDLFDATAPGIGAYNTDVTNEAALNGIMPSATWKALASVVGTSAVSNVGCGASCDTLPIYLVDGTLIGPISNLLAGTNANTITLDQFGNPNSSYVWTGSNSDGTIATGNELGSTNPIIGNPGNVSQQLLISTGVADFTYALYAISNEIDGPLPPFIPEPASGSALLIGGLVVTRVFRRRRRQAA